MESDQFPDTPELHCRHLLVCRNVWHDPARPDEFSLGKILVRVVADDGGPPPVRFDRLFAFAQLFGPGAEYEIWIRLVRIDATEFGEEVELALGPDGEHRDFTRRAVELFDDDFVLSVAIPLRDIAVRETGIYEFQLFAAGRDEPLARERIDARGLP